MPEQQHVNRARQAASSPGRTTLLWLRRLARLRRAPMRAALSGVILAAAVLATFIYHEHARQPDETRAIANDTLARVLQVVEQDMQVLHRLGHWQETQFGISEAQWRADIANYMSVVPDLQQVIWTSAGFDRARTVEWVDQPGQRRLATPERKNTHVHTGHGHAGHDHAENHGPSDHSFALDFPVRYHAGGSGDILRAVFHYPDPGHLLPAEAAAHYQLSLVVDGDPVGPQIATDRSGMITATGQAAGRNWQVTAAPAHGGIRLEELIIPAVLSLLIAVLGLLAASSIHYRQRAIARAKQSRRAHRKLQSAVDAVDAPFAFFDAEDRLQYWNDAFRDMHAEFSSILKHGVRYATLLRAAIDDGQFSMSEDRGKQFFKDRMALHNGDGFVLERELAQGHWIQTIEKRTEDGGVAVLWYDISEQKNRECELRKQRDELANARVRLKREEQKFKAFAEASADWFWITDRDHKYTWLSESIEKHAPIGRESLYGHSRIEIGLEGGTRPEWKTHLQQLARNEPFRDVMFRWLSPQGERWIKSSGTPQFDDDGEFIGYFGTGTDITDLKLTERRYEIVRDQLSKAINAISEGLVIFDPEDRLVLCNDVFRGENHWMKDALHEGATYRETIETAAMSALPEQWSSGQRQLWLEERMNLRDKLDPVMEFENRDGRWCRVAEHRTQDGGTVMVRTDITDLKQRQNDLVLERNNAEEASRAKSEFLTNMSHELRTPLNAIIGFADVMSTGMFGPLPERYDDYVSDIADSGRHLLSLINDLLDTAKIESGDFELCREILPLAPMLHQVASLMQPAFDDQDLTLAVENSLHPDACVNVDPRAVRQVLLNLLSNAAKFSNRAGAVVITIAASEADLDIRIRDGGIGLSDENLERVFERFVQVQDPMHRSHDGTGVGLPLSRSLAVLHGGSLHLESNHDTGVTAVLRLPEVLVAATADAEAEAMRSTA